MITALKVRAMFADYGHEDFDDSCVSENLDLIFEAEKVYNEFANYNTKQEKDKYLGAKIVCEEVEKLKAENIEKWNSIVNQYQRK